MTAKPKVSSLAGEGGQLCVLVILTGSTCVVKTNQRAPVRRIHERCDLPQKSQAPGCPPYSCTWLIAEGHVQGEGVSGRAGFPERLLLRTIAFLFPLALLIPGETLKNYIQPSFHLPVSTGENRS